MTIFDDIKNDMNDGTPGPWRVHNCDSIGDRGINFYQEIWNDDTDILVTTEVTRAYNDGGSANMRRIARVPDMEAALLAAEELATVCSALIDHERPETEAMRAIASFRKSCE